jgi:hypothetical protein
MQVDQLKTRLGRKGREVGERDPVMIAKAAIMAFERGDGALEQFVPHAGRSRVNPLCLGRNGRRLGRRWCDRSGLRRPAGRADASRNRQRTTGDQCGFDECPAGMRFARQPGSLFPNALYHASIYSMNWVSGR